jgi:hypothetical protein
MEVKEKEDVDLLVNLEVEDTKKVINQELEENIIKLQIFM